LPSYADKNLYTGVNPRLNSYLQNPPGRWESFHSLHITHLVESLEVHLPPGYASAAEESLQISQMNASDEDASLNAVTIYQIEANKLPGTPVTRIEVLSPANKPGGSHYLRYREKRRETLKSGLNLVEIDYLHQRRPVLPALPSYVDGEAETYPFLVFVSVWPQLHKDRATHSRHTNPAYNRKMRWFNRNCIDRDSFPTQD